jgi:hypothetical protein
MVRPARPEPRLKLGTGDTDGRTRPAELRGRQLPRRHLPADRDRRHIEQPRAPRATQAEAAAELEKFLGVRWSEAVFSAAERSVAGKRIREFDADTIQAFARTFDLPVAWFFLPPDAETVVGLEEASFDPAAAPVQISLASFVSADIRERIDELTRELPNKDRIALLRSTDTDPGGMREDTLIAGIAERMQVEVDLLRGLAGEGNER